MKQTMNSLDPTLLLDMFGVVQPHHNDAKELPLILHYLPFSFDHIQIILVHHMGPYKAR